MPFLASLSKSVSSAVSSVKQAVSGVSQAAKSTVRALATGVSVLPQFATAVVRSPTTAVATIAQGAAVIKQQGVTETNRQISVRGGGNAVATIAKNQGYVVSNPKQTTYVSAGFRPAVTVPTSQIASSPIVRAEVIAATPQNYTTPQQQAQAVVQQLTAPAVQEQFNATENYINPYNQIQSMPFDPNQIYGGVANLATGNVTAGIAGIASGVLGTGTGGKSTVLAVGRRYILRKNNVTGRLSVSSRSPRRKYYGRSSGGGMTNKLMQMAMIKMMMKD